MKPHPEGVRPFSEYALIVDARTPKEFAEDHIPGSINLPIVNQDEFAEVGTLHKQDPHAAYLLGAQYALRNVARHIGEVIAPLPRKSRLLVYCFRGGKRSRAWADPLVNIGFPVDVLPGGWKAYRAWVREQLDALPQRFEWRVLAGTTACGKTRLLQALQRDGAQVLDLEALACHRGSLLGSLPGQPQPTQKTFDSLLVQHLLQFDAAQPVWVEDESKKVGQLQLPERLYAALHASPTWQLEVPMAARVQVCREDYAHFAADPLAMVAKLQPLKALVGGETLQDWRRLAEAGAVDALFEALMRQHYDPCYRRWLRADRAMHPLSLPDLQTPTLDRAVAGLRQAGAA